MTSDAIPASPPANGVVRPSRAAYARAVKANLWIAIPLLVISLVRVGLNPWLLPVLVVAIGLSVGGVALYFRNARVEFGDGRYRVVSLFGAVREFGLAEIGHLVTITALVAGTAAPTTPQLLLTRPDGTRLLRLRGQTWDVAQFAQLADDLIIHGAALDAITEPITGKDLRLRYPLAVSWAEANPIAWALILGFGIVAVIIALAVIIAVVIVGGFSG